MRLEAPFRERAGLFPHLPYSFQGHKVTFLKDSLGFPGFQTIFHLGNFVSFLVLHPLPFSFLRLSIPSHFFFYLLS